MQKFKNLTVPAARKHLSKIKMVLLDVDGVLTDGTVFWVQGSGWTRVFTVKDGHGIKMLQANGIEVGFITGGNAQDVRERAKLLGVSHLYMGSEDKLTAFKHVMAETGYAPEQIAYIGDELFDLPVLRSVGFSATVPNAPESVKKSVMYITRTVGGSGAAREVIDGILFAQGKEI